jgi:2-oxoisovalerate dehydrogenase E1 component alpha subunit
MARKDRSASANRPRLELHVPEPRFRPGDTVDFSHFAIPEAGAQPRPDESCPAAETYPLCDDMIRVLGEDDRAHGPWDPRLSPDFLREMLRQMALTRAFDNRMYRAQRQGKTSFYLKCTGEEATAVCATRALDFEDMIFPSYRQQGCMIARGYPILEMVNQIYSNRADKLKGRQLPILYSAKSVNFFTISGNLATQLPQATGFAMASAIKGDSKIAAGWVGEGATAEGDFHTALNFAAVYNAPVVFNIINNQWAISSFSGIAGAERSTFAARAIGYGIAGLRVDGNDALAVYAAERWAADRARANAGPTLIEFFTYRAEGHSTSDDPSVYRPAQEGQEWPLGDPIARLKAHLIAIGEWSAERHQAMDAELDEEIKAAQKEAEKNGILGHGLHHPFHTMFEDVFEELPWHLEEQSEQAIRERQIKWPQ